MAIKFYRPYEDYKEHDIVELDATMEDYLVRRNFADNVQIDKKVIEKTKKPVNNDD